MNFSELQREVKALIGDQSSNILLNVADAVNEAVQQICDDVNPPSLKVLLPVTTNASTYYINMPSTFSGKLSYVGDVNGAYSVLDGGLEQLLLKHPDVTVVGDIEDMALEGNILYYLPIPSTAVSLSCIGYNSPATLVNDTDTPTDLPSMYHRESICFKAASILYSYIEDGMEEDKVNTKMFLQLSEVGVNKIRAWVSKRRANVGTSVWSY